jgi:hypothetical protein
LRSPVTSYFAPTPMPLLSVLKEWNFVDPIQEGAPHT